VLAIIGRKRPKPVSTDPTRVWRYLKLGFGSRHIAAANMSAVTKAVGIVVSESSVVRLFCHGQLVGEIIPEVCMMDHAPTCVVL